jgi:hypothetical protein
MSDPGFISPEDEDVCQMCAKIEELRPYGPNGERICFDCAMKDMETSMKQFEKYVLGRDS